MLTIHPRLTPALILRAAKRQMVGSKDSDMGLGFCVACGRKSKDYIEPDASAITCGFQSCGKATVYGAEQLLIMGFGE